MSITACTHNYGSNKFDLQLTLIQLHAVLASLDFQLGFASRPVVGAKLIFGEGGALS